MRDRLRRRNVLESNSTGNTGSTTVLDDVDDLTCTSGERRSTPHGGNLSSLHCLLLILFHVVLLAVAVFAHHYVPDISSEADKPNNSEFAEWRARTHLDVIASYGRRPTGSFANENRTVEYLVKTLRTIKASSHKDIVIDIDVQRPTGAFTIDFLEGFTSYYRNITNVLARVSSRRNYPAKHSVLVNAHFDSSFGGAGASDDAVSCAAMLETIRCLAMSPEHALHHSLVFLFNGAEENLLQGSHGFITQHPWASDIRMFVNLEAAGAGGREIVFQTGPEHPWLIKMYANSAKNPHASIIGQELFQTGLLPAETDFRIFRDYGNIPGVDIAYVTNGYVYHTSRDLPDAITRGSIRRAGDNLLAMVKQLSTSSLVADPSHDQHGAMVFYDFLGLFLVIYPQRIGLILNSLVAVITYVSIVLKIVKPLAKEDTANSRGYRRNGFVGTLSVTELLKSILTIVVSWLVSIALVLGIALLITTNGHSMSWYCKPYVLVGVYILPVVLVVAALHYARATLFQNKHNWSSRWSQEEHTFYAMLFLWNTLLSIMTYFDIGSAFLPLHLVAFPLLARVFLWEFCFGHSSSTNGLATHRGKFVSMYLAATCVPVLLCSYIVWMQVEFFVPILGRTGTNDPPEIIISVFVSFSALIITSYSVSLVYVFNYIKPFVVGITGLWLVSFGAVLLGLVFPFSAQPWCPKRLIIQHISRVLHDSSGRVEHSDSGIWVVPCDFLGVKDIDHLPEFQEAYSPDLQQGLFGDFPYYLPVNFMYGISRYIPGPSPQISKPCSIKLLSREHKGDGYSKLQFLIDGPSHMSLYLSPKPGTRVVGSSLGDLYHRYIPRKGLSSREEYFVYYSHGVYTGPWHFWIDLHMQDFPSNDSVVDIAVAAHYVDEPDSRSVFMSSFLKKLPAWADKTTWVSTYEKYVF